MNALPRTDSSHGGIWWLLGLMACVLAVIANGLAYASASPLFSSGDEVAHLDYAYQVWTGSLPVFEGGPVVRPDVGFAPPVQWVAQHPPLYYLLLAPVVGPVVDAGDVLTAGYLGRGVNIALAGVLTVAVSWASAQAYPHRRAVWIAAALVTAANSWVVRVAGGVYNDLLGAIWGTLLLGMAARILRSGHSTLRQDATLAVLGAAALASRASLVVVLVVCLGVLAAHRWYGSRSLRSAGTAMLRYGLVGLASALPSAWFYLRNLALSGNLLGGRPEWAQQNLAVVPRPVLEVITDPASWRSLLAMYSFAGLPRDAMTAALLVLPAVVGAATWAWTRVRDRTGTEPRARWVLALVLLTPAALLAMQLGYASGGSGLLPRYLLPGVLPFALVIALGLVALPRVAWLTTGAWAAVAMVDFWSWLSARPLAPASPGEPSAPMFLDASRAAFCVAVAALIAAVCCMTLATRRDPDSPTSTVGGPEATPERTYT